MRAQFLSICGFVLKTVKLFLFVNLIFIIRIFFKVGQSLCTSCPTLLLFFIIQKYNKHTFSKNQPKSKVNISKMSEEEKQDPTMQIDSKPTPDTSSLETEAISKAVTTAGEADGSEVQIHAEYLLTIAEINGSGGQSQGT